MELAWYFIKSFETNKELKNKLSANLLCRDRNLPNGVSKYSIFRFFIEIGDMKIREMKVTGELNSLTR